MTMSRDIPETHRSVTTSPTFQPPRPPAACQAMVRFNKTTSFTNSDESGLNVGYRGPAS
jgi:hypothetical protein